MPTTQTLNWTSVAVTTEGRFVVQPAKSAARETLFSLTFTRTDNSRSHQTFTLIGLFASPDVARLAAGVFPRR